MNEEVKTPSIIEANIEARVQSDINEMSKELKAVMIKYFPSSIHGSYDHSRYLTGPVSPAFDAFLKAVKPIAHEHLKQKRDKQFSEILTNLGSYLEMINHL